MAYRVNGLLAWVGSAPPGGDAASGGARRRRSTRRNRTLDGATHRTRLLASGWWGLARHPNYVGDIMMAASFGLACGVGHALPYVYAGYLTVLLVHRTRRDDHRCREKYGAAWDEYCRAVPYRLTPYVW